jgi:chromosome segregation protein
VFLKRIELFGFKSFADRTVIEFTEGVTALLGPNGCGKSNVVDSLKWVLGEQSSRNMRAEKMEDVIFNGTEARKALNVAEVNLIVSNEEGYLDLDVAEISIKRRLFRSGESEYYINNTPVRLKEIREIFFDTGIGKSAYSIMEQGRIDQLLSTKPEDRRFVFEEAAGITKYKIKKSEAERKLDQTEQNMENVESILSEVRKQYETLKIQCEKTLRYREYQKQLYDLDRDLSLLKIRYLMDQKEQKKKQAEADRTRMDGADSDIRNLSGELKEFLDRISAMESDLNENQKKIYGMDLEKDNRENQFRLLKERQHELEESTGSLLVRKSNIEEKLNLLNGERTVKNDQLDSSSGRLRDLDKNILEFEETIEKTAREIESNRNEISERDQKTLDSDKLREELEISLREVANEIVIELDKGLKEAEPAFKEKEVLEQLLQERLSGLAIQIKGRCDMLGDLVKLGSGNDKVIMEALTVQRDFLASAADMVEASLADLERCKNLNPDFLNRFVTPEGYVTRKREMEQRIGSLIESIRENRRRIEELGMRNGELGRQIDEYRGVLSELKVRKAEIAANLAALLESIKKLDENIFEEEERRKELDRQIESDRQRIEDLKARLDLLVNEKKDIDREKQVLIEKQKQLDGQIRTSGQEIEDKRQLLEKRKETRNQLALDLEKRLLESGYIDEQMAEVERDFQEKYSRKLSDHMERIDQITQPTAELRDLYTRIRQESKKLEYGLNYMAPEEYAEVEERFNFLQAQLNDLRKAREDLHQVTATIKQETEQLFLQTYELIKKNFHDQFRKLFGGGRADIELVDTQDILNCGIEIYVQPPGKKLENIALLSGGEKSLTGIALLFAIFLVKPSPFCVLDEIDAALDEANIQRFVDLLADFSDNSQFIIITHNKRTVTGASTLLGVTMQESGISTLISMRLAGEESTDGEREETEG